MTTKKKARARTKKVPAAKAQPAPEAVAAVVRNVRPRWDPTIPPRDRNPRPLGDLTRTARLVRGKTYTLTWSDDPVYFHNPGPAVEITESEFERLVKAVDKIDFQDPGKGMRTIRFIRKFQFHQVDSGELIELPALPDVDAGEYAISLGEQAERDRLFEGQEHTAR